MHPCGWTESSQWRLQSAPVEVARLTRGCSASALTLPWLPTNSIGRAQSTEPSGGRCSAPNTTGETRSWGGGTVGSMGDGRRGQRGKGRSAPGGEALTLHGASRCAHSVHEVWA